MNGLRIVALLCAFGSIGYDLPAGAALQGRRAPAETPAALSAQHGVALASIDPTCKPCDDFYRYANGGWLAANPIPPTQSKWSPIEALRELNTLRVREALEAIAHESPPDGSLAQKAADYYSSCMDTREREAAGLGPLAPYLSGIASVHTLAGIRFETAIVQNLGANAFFSASAQADPRETGHTIAVVAQGGLGLPDRELYLSGDPHAAAIRESYLAHVARYFVLAGDPPTTALADARAVMTIEVALARASRSRAERRDRVANYHKLTLSELQTIAPTWDLGAFFLDRLAPHVEAIDVEQPEFVRALEVVVHTTPIADLRSYLRYHLLARYAASLSTPFADEAQALEDVLTGTREPLPQWSRCVRATEADLPDAVGQVYAARMATPATRMAARAMVSALVTSFRDDIATLAWMSEQTRREMLAKVESIAEQVDYPDTARTYRTFDVDRGVFAANVVRANLYRSRGVLAALDRPPNLGLWPLGAAVTNALYTPTINAITIPAGMLQAPLYSPRYDEAANLGAIGAYIGHELTHAFDDQGQRGDAHGMLHDWPAADTAQFAARSACIERFYDRDYDAKLVVGEGLADLGGAEIAFHALERSLVGHPRPKIDGWTPEQRFFLAFAQARVAAERPERARLDAIVDPHPRGRDRVMVTLTNMPEFAAAFRCRATDAMVRVAADRCSLW